MNILHLQFDTEIRTLYQVEAMNKISKHNIVLAYSGPNYKERFGHGDDLFSKVYTLPNISLKEIFYIRFSKQFKELVRDINKIIADEDIDVIHVHKRTDLQCLAALETGIPVIIDVHDLVCVIEDSIFGKQGHWAFNLPIVGRGFGKLFYKKLIQLEKDCLKRADYLTAVSPVMKFKLVSSYDLTDDKIEVLPNTVPINYCSLVPKNRGHLPFKGLMATSFFLDKNSKSHRNILPFINIIKNIDTLKVDLFGWTKGFNYRELELFFSEYPSITYSGLLSPAQYLQTIQKYDLGIIFNNPMYDKQIGEMSLPKKFFEYAANGLPILAYGSSQIADFINHFEIGAIFDELTEESVNKAIRDIEENYELYSYNALNLVKKEYNWEIQAKLLLDIYSRSIKERLVHQIK